MFLSCIVILILSLMNVLAEPPDNPDKTTTSVQKPRDPPIPILTSPTPIASADHCEGDDCRPPANLIGPIVGALCAIFVIAIIGVFIVWFYLRQKSQKTKEMPITSPVSFIEQPPLYTAAISTTDSTSRLYGMSPLRNDSIASHHYEKIVYNDQS